MANADAFAKRRRIKGKRKAIVISPNLRASGGGMNLYCGQEWGRGKSGDRHSRARKGPAGDEVEPGERE